MYRNTNLLHPSRQQSQTQQDPSQPLYPRQSEIYPQQSAFSMHDHQQQLPQARGQGSSDTRGPTSQGPNQPCSVVEKRYRIQHRTHQEHHPTVPPYASSQSVYQVAQAMDKNNHVHVQSNLEQIPYSSPSATSRAFFHDPSFEKNITCSGDALAGEVDESVELTQAFFDSADGNQFDMPNPLWDADFDVLWADWQVTDPDTDAGETWQFNHEPLPDSQLGKQQPYPDSGFGTGHQSYSGGPFRISSGVKSMQPNHEQFISPQPPSLAGVNQLDQTTPFTTLAGHVDDPPYGNTEFSWATTSQGPWNNTLQHPRSQQYRDSEDLASSNTTPYQNTEDSSASQNEQFWVPMHPRRPRHRISTSGTSSSGYRTSDHEHVEKFSASKQSTRGGPRHRFVHGHLNQYPIAISRIAKKPAKERAHFFCARGGCEKQVGRLSDLDRHEKTQHRQEEDGFPCLFCPLERQKKFSVIYNLRAHIARTHTEVDLHTNPDGPTVLSWKDNFAKVPFYKNYLDGEILLRAHTDIATVLAGLKASSSGNEDLDLLQTAFDEKLEQWMNSI